ncbi:ESPR-type extended signal peptide-containing protein, partial [Acinetobacter rudis]|uniref:ESPR-type extended signal peptide-containing protein n=1 Tax=Acinetobacter rudis TaxID=632955 RepID=UPI00280D7D25
MNKIYKCIWNSSLSVWIAVSENSKGKSKSKCSSVTRLNNIAEPDSNKKAVKLLILSTIITLPSMVHAAPGLWINDGTDSGCTLIGDPYSETGAMSGKANCVPSNVNTQSTSTIFFGNNDGSGSRHLTIAGSVYANAGNLGLGGAQTGLTNTSNAKGSIRIGGGVANNGNGTSTAAGTLAQNSGQYAIAIGGGETTANATQAAANDSISVGTFAKVTTAGTGGVSIGRQSSVNVATGVALGDSSTATTAAGIDGYTGTGSAADKAAIGSTKSSLGAMSVGDITNKKFRQITGVAAGTADYDVVNVAQLKALNNNVVTNAQTISQALGGGSTVDADGKVTAPSYSVDGKTVTNVGDAISNVDARVTDNTSNISNLTQTLNDGA